MSAVPVQAWANPPPLTWYTNGASNERYWQSGVATQAAPGQGVTGIFQSYRPAPTIPPVQFGPDVLLSAGRKVVQMGDQPAACLANNDAGAQPTHIMATKSAGPAIGAILHANEYSFSSLTSRTCDALVAPLLISAAAGPDSQLIIAKVVDFSGGAGLHVLFLSFACPGGNCGFGLIQDIFLGTVPAKPSGALWWEPNQGQGYSALQDPLNPSPFYDDLVFILNAGGGFSSRMISIDYGVGSAFQWQDRFAGLGPGALPPACPGLGNCVWNPVRPPPEWPGFIRATNDLAEFSKIGPNAAGHFTGMNVIDAQTQRPWLLVVDFKPQVPQLYYGDTLQNWWGNPVLPATVFGLMCFSYSPVNPLPPPPFNDGPQSWGDGDWVAGEIGMCLNSYQDPNQLRPATLKKVMLQWQPAKIVVIPCTPGPPAGSPPCTVSDNTAVLNLALQGNLRGWNIPFFSLEEAWVVTVNPNQGLPRLEIQRVSAAGWGLAAVGGAILYGAGNGGWAGTVKVTSGFTGTLDGHAARRFWIVVFNDQGWACDPDGSQPSNNQWTAQVLTIDLVIPNPAITLIHAFSVMAPQQGTGCPAGLAPYNEPFSPAMIVSQNPVNQMEQVWLHAPRSVAAFNNFGGMLLLYQF